MKVNYEWRNAQNHLLGKTRNIKLKIKASEAFFQLF